MSVRDYSLTFGAPGVQTLRAQGRFVRVYAADATGVTIKPRNGSPLLRFTGQDVDVGVLKYDWLDISVTVASTVRLGISDDRQFDNQTNINSIVSATITPGKTLNAGGDVVCGNAATTQLIPADATRLAAILCVSANAPAYVAGTVRIGGAAVAAGAGVEINPGEKLVLDSQAIISCYNNSGAAVTVQVLPINE